MATYGIPTKALHEQWLGLVQPVGLVVAPAVLTKLELVPEQRIARLSALQLELAGLLDEVDGVNDQPVKAVSSFRHLATELLEWAEADLLDLEALVPDRAPEGVPEVVLSEYGETLRPTHGVPKLEGEGLQALVLDLTQWRDASGTLTPQWGRDLDAAWNPTGNGWDATPQQRFERLLKETEHPIGLLFNGSQLRLVHAPRGESSGHITLPLEPMAEVAGRPMLGALELLLGVDRLFGGNPEQRLPAVLAASRKNQNEVSTRLSEQVLEALWELLLGFDAAERLAQQSGRTVLGALPTTEEGQKHLYGGLITVLLRLVFLLYAEDEALMPRDSLYGQHYSVSALADRLRQDRVEHQSGMTHRVGAWASLLSLFRLLYDGGGPDPNYLPARHGELFDPDGYPFLEGRTADTAYNDGILANVPALSDDVLEKVLSKLIWLDGERLSYRALDVEQIGSVYEGIMGFTVEGATGPSVGITYRPPRQKITITVVVDAEQLLAVAAGKREKWLDEQAGVALKLPAKVKEGLKQATSLAELCLGLGNRLSPHTPNGLATGSLILQPTAERRRSGSHYTPRALTEPIVAEAFRPWLERCNHQPTAEQILALKVCDPAMGSGAFLVAVCRFLAGWLVQAWERDGYPEGFRQEWDKDTVARRLIAQSCLYGVDKNPFAVNLAKLSLWLVTLSKELPFTFVDHALKCGDSLVGYSVQDIRAAMREVQLGFLDDQNRIYEQMGIDRRESFSFDSLTDADYDTKKLRLEQQIKATEGLRQAGDLMVAAFFAKSRPKDRAEKQQVYLAMLSGTFDDEGLQDSIQEIRDRLAASDRGIRPFHWDLEFPEVFEDKRGGFDVFVGNPPFLGGSRISEVFGSAYFAYLTSAFIGCIHHCDLVAYFFRRAYGYCRKLGSVGLVSTNTISQGDTREGGLLRILEMGGCIYSAEKRRSWPGNAAVVVSIVHIAKESLIRPVVLDGREVGRISAYLKAASIDATPNRLSGTPYFSLGSKIYGQGFLFSDNDDGSTPLRAKERITTENPDSENRIFPYLVGEEINSDPHQRPGRYVIFLSDIEKESDLEGLGEIVDIVRDRVRPERMRLGDNANNIPLKKRWWAYQAHRPELYSRIAGKHRVLCLSQVGKALAFCFCPSNYIFSHKVVVIDTDDMRVFGVLQSSLHELWTKFTSSSLKDDVNYSPSDCLETFAFPLAATGDQLSAPKLLDHNLANQLEEASNCFYLMRTQLMVNNNEGLTSTYNRFHDPAETSPSLLELRDLHTEMDQAVLAAYGWSDALTQAIADNPHHTPCGFGLDYLDLEEDAQLPEELQERIDAGDLFFWDANDALDFQGQLRAAGAVKAKKRLPWRYRWPDSVRDDILARLLALNAERYEEEVAMGLHSKGAKKTAGAQRGRKPKSDPPRNQSSFQLEPEPLQMDFNLSGGR